MDSRNLQTILITEPSIADSFDKGEKSHPLVRQSKQLELELSMESVSQVPDEHLLSPNSPHMSRKSSERSSSEESTSISSVSSNSFSSISSSSRSSFFSFLSGTSKIFSKVLHPTTPSVSVEEMGKEDAYRVSKKSLRRSKSVGSDNIPLYALFLGEKYVSKSKSAEVPKSKHYDATGTENGNGKWKKFLAIQSKLKELAKRSSSEDASSIRPSYSEAILWSNSFQNLLSSKYGLSLFRAFLTTEHSEENLDFWIACENFKKCRLNKLQCRGIKIYNKFLVSSSSHQINLDHETKNTILTELNTIPSKHCFESAQKRARSILENDAYPRFVKSNLYLELICPSGQSETRSKLVSAVSHAALR